MEVASFPSPLTQFYSGLSAYMCVAFGCADINFSGRPGQAPAGTPGQAAALAEHWYALLEGSDAASNHNGMSVGAEYQMLAGLGMRYVGLQGDLVAQTRQYLNHGIPVLICGAESGFYDTGLGKVPYGWDPVFNHCIVASGIANNDNFYVRDYANVEATPGTPRVYDASKMSLVSATAVYPHWSSGMIPFGWKDNATTGELTAPNGVQVRQGFREFIISHGWDSTDLPIEAEAARAPLEDSNAALGAGTYQTFLRSILEWTKDRGVFIGFVGQELVKVRLELAAAQAAAGQTPAAVKAAVDKATADIKTAQESAAQAAADIASLG